MRSASLIIVSLILHLYSYSQNPPKELAATRSVLAIKIDGLLDEIAWKEAKG